MATKEEEVISLLLDRHTAKLPLQQADDDLTNPRDYNRARLIKQGEESIQNCISVIPLGIKPQATLIVGGSDYVTDYASIYCTGPRLGGRIMDKAYQKAIAARERGQTTAKVVIGFLQVSDDDTMKTKTPNSIIGRLVEMAGRSTHDVPVPAELEVECAGIRVLVSLREHLQLPIKDNPDENVKPYLNMCADFINQSTDEDDLTLVLCRQGINRSVTMLLAFLIKYAGMSQDQAYAFLQIHRPVLAHYDGCTFREALSIFEERRDSGDLERLAFSDTPIALPASASFVTAPLVFKPLDKSRLSRRSLNSMSSLASRDLSASPTPSDISSRPSTPVPWWIRGRSASSVVSVPTTESVDDEQQSTALRL